MALQKTILDAIGNTPLVTLSKVTSSVKPEIAAKIEYFSPTGSLKDRIYLKMILEAEKRGDLKKGSTIIECSTGNAGIACSFVGALRGYKVVIVMPEGMSEERKKLIRSYGAELVETPGGESDVDLALKKLSEIKAKTPDKYWEPAQFSNPDNILAHFEGTGPEIWEQSEGRVDVFVASQGTGGTITGVGRYLKGKNPSVKLFAVEPSECPILSKRKWGEHKIEGIGDGFVPRNLDLSMLDGVVLMASEEAIEMARRLSKEEGLFAGISSGCNVSAAVKIAKKFPDARLIVTMINDTGQRYFSTELCQEKSEVLSPEREHPLDEYTLRELDKYQSRWEIIE